MDSYFANSNTYSDLSFTARYLNICGIPLDNVLPELQGSISSSQYAPLQNTVTGLRIYNNDMGSLLHVHGNAVGTPSP